MVTISDFNEDNHNDTRTKPLSSSFQSPSSSSSSFSPTFDPSNLTVFLHKVFDFVSHESDFFGIDAAKKEIASLTRATREKRKKAKELKAAAVAKHEAKKKLEKRLASEGNSAAITLTVELVRVLNGLHSIWQNEVPYHNPQTKDYMGVAPLIDKLEKEKLKDKESSLNLFEEPSNSDTDEDDQGSPGRHCRIVSTTSRRSSTRIKTCLTVSPMWRRWTLLLD
ncbi:hypothetical protein PIB30_046611 [Stylosanthes scabra]|uniref:Uncharacterized protein n=1 Tax=Stylosanthes scabra TaxID=79078 RepID=A0ABU6TGA7_9FABA|nr:hypothetical protein [Stylosanthes scabra]